MAGNFVTGSPIKYRKKGNWEEFPMKFRWQTGLWFELFEKHLDLIVEDIKRAQAEDRLITYLSCPISGREGSHSLTNIEITRHVARQLETKWGSRFWVLNPALYQMESSSGTGLIKRHAHLLSAEKGLMPEIDIEQLHKESPLTGGDYLRMWTKVLVGDDADNLGNRFDAFYFIGPVDVWNFFTNSGNTDLTRGVEDYFARKIATNAEFRSCFGEARKIDDAEREFFKFYTLKAGAHFSLGSHDEYNIWQIHNVLRRREIRPLASIPGYFDGRQIGLGAAETELSPGYAIN